MSRKSRTTNITGPWRAPLSVALLAVGSLLLPAAVVSAAEVSLTGESQVRYVPDSARLNFTVTAEHPEANKATSEVHQTMSQWRDAIADYRDQLANYSDASVHLYQRRLPSDDGAGDEKTETVAVASQTVSFEITDLNLLNPLLEQAQSLGMNYNLGPGQFFHSREDDLRKQALAAAIEDARTRCQFAAKQLDMECGEVKTLNLQDGGHQPIPMMMSEARGARKIVSDVGQREITVSVSATFTMH